MSNCIIGNYVVFYTVAHNFERSFLWKPHRWLISGAMSCAKIARYVWDGTLEEKVYDILNIVKEDTPRVRCCVHKERAVLKNRIQMALWQ